MLKTAYLTMPRCTRATWRPKIWFVGNKLIFLLWSDFCKMIEPLWPSLNKKLENLWTCNWQQKRAQFKFYRWGYIQVAWVSIKEIMTSGKKLAISNWLLRFVFQKPWFFSGADFNALHQRYDQKYKTKVSGNALKYTWLIFH